MGHGSSIVGVIKVNLVMEVMNLVVSCALTLVWMQEKVNGI